MKSADFLEDIYIPQEVSVTSWAIYISQEVELLPEGYKYCPEIRSGMGYIPLAVPLILELPELQRQLMRLSIEDKIMDFQNIDKNYDNYYGV